MCLQIWWVPPVSLHTSCELDWTYWPWDRQTCHLVVGSWTKTGWELDVQNLSGQNISSLDTSNFAASAWDLVRGRQQRRVYNDFAGTQAALGGTTNFSSIFPFSNNYRVLIYLEMQCNLSTVGNTTLDRISTSTWT